MDYGLSQETQVTLLLCGTLGGSRGDTSPLSARQYGRLCAWLDSQSLGLTELIEPDVLESLSISTDREPKLDPLRLQKLLARGAAMALSVESWSQQGIWLTDCWDDAYTPNFIDRLDDSAPPLLWGLGDKELLSVGGLAIVGSRDVDARGLAFTERVARQCANEEISIVSGGARGVDGAAMRAALGAGGIVVGILPNGLARTPVGEIYEAIEGGRLLLISQYDPQAPFTVGNAMGRNRSIYAFANWSLVSSSASGKGGTWAGATEDLKQRYSPLFVREADGTPPGNDALLRQGALAFPENLLDSDECPESLQEWLEGQSKDWARAGDDKEDAEQLAMF